MLPRRGLRVNPNIMRIQGTDAAPRASSEAGRPCSVTRCTFGSARAEPFEPRVLKMVSTCRGRITGEAVHTVAFRDIRDSPVSS